MQQGLARIGMPTGRVGMNAKGDCTIALSGVEEVKSDLLRRGPRKMRRCPARKRVELYYFTAKGMYLPQAKSPSWTQALRPMTPDIRKA